METSTTTTTATKRCAKCGRELPLTEFHKRAKAKDGLQAYCKACLAKCNKEQKIRAKFTPPQSVTAEPHPVFSKMQPREIQSEIRERVNYLRSTGWECEVKLKFVQVKEVTL